MIILSRRKDYYDYLVGVYGRDEKKVYDRLNDITSDELPYEDIEVFRELNIYDLLICNRIYRVEQVQEGVWELHKFHTVNTNYRGERRHYRETQVSDLKDFVYYIPNHHVLSIGIPISIRRTYCRVDNLKGISPILGTFGIASVLSAVELYSEIDMYIPSVMPDKESRIEQSNENKILSKGFDSKVSFRRRK